MFLWNDTWSYQRRESSLADLADGCEGWGKAFGELGSLVRPAEGFSEHRSLYARDEATLFRAE